MLITMVFGTILGVMAGFFRGPIDGVISRINDIVWSYPAVLLGITLGTVLNIRGLGPFHSTTLLTTALVVGFVYIPYVVRPIRAQVLTLREREFVDAARQQGLGNLRIMFGEILPNVASTIIIFIPLMLANAILLEAALSYLGAGVQPPNSSWGTMIQAGLVDFPGRLPHGARARHHAGAHGDVGEHLRRRPARCARSALEGGHLMARFVTRRADHDGVHAVRDLTRDVPAVHRRVAGRQPGRDDRRAPGDTRRGAPDRRPLRLRQADLRPVHPHDGEHLRRQPPSPTSRASTCSQQIAAGLPATLSLAIGAGILWLLASIALGHARRDPLRQVHRPRADRAVDGRRLAAAVPARLRC